ncbi:hypothetical protein D1007_49783 [Hordeum vulgare]|nr:hypothetical protein D1007_49783 [Hordeum vulgare]
MNMYVCMAMIRTCTLMTPDFFLGTSLSTLSSGRPSRSSRSSTPSAAASAKSTRAAAAQQLRLPRGVGHDLAGERVVRHQHLGQRRLQGRRGVVATSTRRVVVAGGVAEEDADVDGGQDEVEVGERQAVLLQRQRRHHGGRERHGHLVAAVAFGGRLTLIVVHHDARARVVTCVSCRGGSCVL